MIGAKTLTTAVAGILFLTAACGGVGVVAGPLNCDGLDGVDRYRLETFYSLVQGAREGEPTDDDGYPEEGLSLEQTVEATVDGDGMEASTEFSDPGLVGQHFIFIGDRFWLNQGGVWREEPAAGGASPLAIDVERVCSALEQSGLPGDGQEPVEDTVEGVSALRYDISDADSDFMGYIWGEESDMGRLTREISGSVWVDPDRKYLLAADVEATGQYSSGRELTSVVFIQMSDINDSSIRVEPPEEF